jgi:DeoR family fructose operon transcriptional repressor
MNQNEIAFKLKDTRHKEIVQIVNEKQSVTVNYLARTLYSSLTTIRRDLKELHKIGLISRIHGGATIPNTFSSEESHLFKESLNADKKKMIAGLVSGFLENNQTIFLDGSTTNRYLIPYFHNFNNMVFITNSYKTVTELSNLNNSEIYLAGGKALNNFNHTSGNLTVDFLNHFRAEVCIMACKGISATSGCTVVNSEQAIIKSTMIKNSRVRILMCDSTKFSKVYLFHFANFSDFDYLVTDQIPEEGLRSAIEITGCKIITPKGEK